MNFSIVWIMDKLGYMPKPAIRIDLQEWPFPVKKPAKKTVKIPKATTRKKPATKK